MLRKYAAIAVFVLFMPLAAPADVITNLVGDARDGIPDNLVVLVTAVNNNDGSFTVTIDLGPMSGDHDDVKMQNFFFNVVGAADDYEIDVTDPVNWSFGDGNNAQGSGSADFEFELGKDRGNSANVEIGTNLVFTIRWLAGDISDDNFLNAERSSSSVGSGSAGAHLQSLSDTGCSGFVWGTWGAQPTGPVGDGTETTCGSVDVPEPGTLALLGLGILGLAFRRRLVRTAI